MGVLIRFALIALAIAVVVWVVVRSYRGQRLKCAGCRHCRKLFHDGSLCGFGTKETFKTVVHIENCMDYEPRGRPGSQSS